ncbi:MAG: NUDIX domain-containing protein [Cyanobacteria bacterium J06627_8]
MLNQLWHFAKSAIKLILRHPVTGTSIIPILPDGRIILIRRRDTGRWGLPGGMVDWGEDIPTTVKRELLEETGLELKAINRLVGVYSAPNRDPRFHSICVVVEATVDGTINVTDTLEIMDVRAFRLADIELRQLSHDHEQHVHDYLAGQTVLR